MGVTELCFLSLGHQSRRQREGAIRRLFGLERCESSRPRLPRLAGYRIITGCYFPRLFHLRSSKHLTPINTVHSRWGVSTGQARETEARRHSLGLSVSHLWGLEPGNHDAQALGQIPHQLRREGGCYVFEAGTNSCGQGFWCLPRTRGPSHHQSTPDEERRHVELYGLVYKHPQHHPSGERWKYSKLYFQALVWQQGCLSSNEWSSDHFPLIAT